VLTRTRSSPPPLEAGIENFPHYTCGERIADGCIHIAGIAASLAAAAILITISFTSLPPLTTVSVVIYSVGLVAVFGFSAGYHLVTLPSLKAILRRCDHAAIFVKIAATYTPFAMVKIGGIAGHTLLGGVWAIAVVGIIAKLAWPQRFPRAAYALYLGQGWAGIAAFNSLMEALSTSTLVLLGMGGCLYTIGVVFHLWRTLPYHNAIWHALVLTASACLFAAVVEAVAT
jgi:hemolysin III